MKARFLPTTAALALLGLPLHAATVTWDFGAGTNAWSTGTNWDTNTEPTTLDDVVLASGLGATLSLSTGEQALSLLFRADYTLAGGTLAVGAGGISTDAGVTATVNTNLTAASGLVKGGFGTLAFGPAVTSARTTVTTVNDGTLRLSGATSLGAASPVTLAGGTLDLRNDTNTNYAHPITVGSGTNTVNVDRAVGGVAAGGTHTLGTVALAGQTLNTAGSNGFGLALGATSTTSTASLNHDAPGALTAASIGLGGTSGTFTFTMDGDGGAVSVTGALAESGTPIYNFAKRGTHTLHLGTSFVARGTLTVAAGTLDLNNLNVALTSTMTIGGGGLGTAASVTTGTGSLTLGSTLTFSSSTSPLGATITGNLDLGAAARTFTINDSGNAAVDLDIAGPISGPAGIGFTKNGAGTLRLSGAGNSFTGLATLQVGTLELGKAGGNAIGVGGLSISNTSTATVRLLAANQINDAAPVSITNNSSTARLDLAGFSETLGATAITAGTTSGASITTGALGTLVLGGNLTLANNVNSASAGQRRVLITGTGTVNTGANNGTLDLGGAVRNVAVTTTVTGANAPNASALIETVIVNGGIAKTGSQTLFLTNPASTFAGGLSIAQGTVDASAGGVAGVGPVTFTSTGADTAHFAMSGSGQTLANPFVVAGSGTGETGIVYLGPIGTTFTASGGITLGRNLTVDAAEGTVDNGEVAQMIFSGAIDDGAGTFALIKKGSGGLRLTNTNTHGGGTFIQRGTLGVSSGAALGETGVAVTIAGGVLHAEASFATSRPVIFTAAGSVRTDAGTTLELTGAVTHTGSDMGFFGAGQTIVSGTGGGGSGNLMIGNHPNAFADAVGTYEDIGYGHVFSLRGAFALPGGNVALDRNGVLELGTGDFTRALGSGAGQVRMQTSTGGGFAAFGANRIVNLGGAGATLVWGDATTKFLRGPALFGAGEDVGGLVLGSTTATHTVEFRNPIEFNNGDSSPGRYIVVPNGPAAKEAIISGGLSLNGLPGTAEVFLDLEVAGALEISGVISGAISLYLFDGGSLTLTAANTHTLGTYIDGATLIVNSDAALGAAGSLVEFYDNSTLRAAGAITSDRTFGLYGDNIAFDTNGFAVTLGAGSTVDGTELIKTGAGTLTLAGTQTYGTLTANAGTTNVNSVVGTGSSIVNANATVNFGASQTLAELNIAAGVEVTFGDGLPLTGGPGKSGASAVVPEPGGTASLLGGMLTLLAFRRRRG